MTEDLKWNPRSSTATNDFSGEFAQLKLSVIRPALEAELQCALHLFDVMRRILPILRLACEIQLGIAVRDLHHRAVEAAELVGRASAPPNEPTERDRAWFFKLFCLRGMKDGQERMFFFAFLQKTDEML